VLYLSALVIFHRRYTNGHYLLPSQDAYHNVQCAYAGKLNHVAPNRLTSTAELRRKQAPSRLSIGLQRLHGEQCCSTDHCLNHSYTANRKPANSMQLRHRGHNFALPTIHLEFHKTLRRSCIVWLCLMYVACLFYKITLGQFFIHF